MWRAVGLALLAVLDTGRASPNHDEVQAESQMHWSTQRYTEGRRLSIGAAEDETCEQVHAKPMESIRIGYEFLDAEGVDPNVRDYIEHVVLARAIRYWQRTLKVHRAVAPLRAERRGINCTKYALGFTGWVIAQEKSYTCQAAETPTCGGEHLPIPSKYLKATRICSKQCPDVVETFTHLLGHGGGMCDKCSYLPAGPGADGYDFLAFITLRDGKYCNGMTQAHATSCVKDQCDRPIFGLVNFCLSKISLSPKDTDRQVSTAVHELAHALAFSSHHFGYFRHTDGTPKLPRVAEDSTVLQNSVRWSCSGTSYTWDDPNGQRSYVDLAEAGVIMKFNERGLESCPCPVGVRMMYPGCIQPPAPAFRAPKCVFKMVTPRVREKAREFFDCDWLPGAELENQPTSQCVIVGSHWEERIFMGELMTSGQFEDYIFLSPVTLAIFEDSGWYMPDYNMADPLVEGVHWGYRQGCPFATEKCVSNGKTEFPRFWCAKKGARTCGLDRMGEVQCTMVPSPAPLPPTVDYYSSSMIGDTAEADYCPYYHTRISNHVCTNTSSSTFPISNVNFMREVFGAASRCLDSTLHANVEEGEGVYEADPTLFSEARPGCFQVACGIDGASYDVLVSNLQGATTKLGTCVAAGQTIGVTWLQGSVTCAAPAELCGVGLRRARHASTSLYEEEKAGPVSVAAAGQRRPRGGSGAAYPRLGLSWAAVAVVGAWASLAVWRCRRTGGATRGAAWVASSIGQFRPVRGAEEKPATPTLE